MTTVERNILVNTTADNAFRYLSDPTHFREYCVNMIGVSDVHRHPLDNTEFSWVYKMVDARLEGQAEIQALRHDQALCIQFRGVFTAG